MSWHLGKVSFVNSVSADLLFVNVVYSLLGLRFWTWLSFFFLLREKNVNCLILLVIGLSALRVVPQFVLKKRGGREPCSLIPVSLLLLLAFYEGSHYVNTGLFLLYIISLNFKCTAFQFFSLHSWKTVMSHCWCV